MYIGYDTSFERAELNTVNPFTVKHKDVSDKNIEIYVQHFLCINEIHVIATIKWYTGKTL